ncbi:unnamed protein product [Amoebophrya sp. A120]|nr:unnamed protein product [Amoebophrya sp. A120]|eukprot:GSA120T00013421001.1
MIVLCARPRHWFINNLSSLFLLVFVLLQDLQELLLHHLVGEQTAVHRSTTIGPYPTTSTAFALAAEDVAVWNENARTSAESQSSIKTFELYPGDRAPLFSCDMFPTWQVFKRFYKSFQQYVRTVYVQNDMATVLEKHTDFFSPTNSKFLHPGQAEKLLRELETRMEQQGELEISVIKDEANTADPHGDETAGADATGTVSVFSIPDLKSGAHLGAKPATSGVVVASSPYDNAHLGDIFRVEHAEFAEEDTRGEEQKKLDQDHVDDRRGTAKVVSSSKEHDQSGAPAATTEARPKVEDPSVVDARRATATDDKNRLLRATLEKLQGLEEVFFQLLKFAAPKYQQWFGFQNDHSEEFLARIRRLYEAFLHFSTNPDEVHILETHLTESVDLSNAYLSNLFRLVQARISNESGSWNEVWKLYLQKSVGSREWHLFLERQGIIATTDRTATTTTGQLQPDLLQHQQEQHELYLKYLSEFEEMLFCPTGTALLMHVIFLAQKYHLIHSAGSISHEAGYLANALGWVFDLGSGNYQFDFLEETELGEVFVVDRNRENDLLVSHFDLITDLVSTSSKGDADRKFYGSYAYWEKLNPVRNFPDVGDHHDEKWNVEAFNCPFTYWRTRTPGARSSMREDDADGPARGQKQNQKQHNEVPIPIDQRTQNVELLLFEQTKRQWKLCLDAARRGGSYQSATKDEKNIANNIIPRDELVEAPAMVDHYPSSPEYYPPPAEEVDPSAGGEEHDEELAAFEAFARQESSQDEPAPGCSSRGSGSTSTRVEAKIKNGGMAKNKWVAKRLPDGTLLFEQQDGDERGVESESSSSEDGEKSLSLVLHSTKFTKLELRYLHFLATGVLASTSSWSSPAPHGATSSSAFYFQSPEQQQADGGGGAVGGGAPRMLQAVNIAVFGCHLATSSEYASSLLGAMAYADHFDYRTSSDEKHAENKDSSTGSSTGSRNDPKPPPKDLFDNLTQKPRVGYYFAYKIYLKNTVVGNQSPVFASWEDFFGAPQPDLNPEYVDFDATSTSTTGATETRTSEQDERTARTDRGSSSSSTTTSASTSFYSRRAPWHSVNFKTKASFYESEKLERQRLLHNRELVSEVRKNETAAAAAIENAGHVVGSSSGEEQGRLGKNTVVAGTVNKYYAATAPLASEGEEAAAAAAGPGHQAGQGLEVEPPAHQLPEVLQDNHATRNTFLEPERWLHFDVRKQLSRFFATDSFEDLLFNNKNVAGILSNGVAAGDASGGGTTGNKTHGRSSIEGASGGGTTGTNRAEGDASGGGTTGSGSSSFSTFYETWTQAVFALQVFLANDDYFHRHVNVVLGCEPFWLCILLIHAFPPAVTGKKFIVRLNMCPMLAFSKFFGQQNLGAGSSAASSTINGEGNNDKGSVNQEQPYDLAFALILEALYGKTRASGRDGKEADENQSEGVFFSSATRISAEMFRHVYGRRPLYVPMLGLHASHNFLQDSRWSAAAGADSDEEGGARTEVSRTSTRDAVIPGRRRSFRNLSPEKDYNLRSASSLSSSSSFVGRGFVSGGPHAEHAELHRRAPPDRKNANAAQIPDEQYQVLLFRSRLPYQSLVMNLLAAYEDRKLRDEAEAEAETGVPTERRKRIVTIPESSNMEFSQMQKFRAIIVLPHVPNALRLSDLTALHVPILIPSEPFVYRTVWPLSGCYCGQSDSQIPMMQRRAPWNKIRTFADRVLAKVVSSSSTDLDPDAETTTIKDRTAAPAEEEKTSRPAADDWGHQGNKHEEEASHDLLHPYDVFHWQSTEAVWPHKFLNDRKYWYRFSEWFERKDILLRFRSVRHLYQLATNNEHDFLYPELTEKMQKYQAKIMKTALTWWRIALEL